MFRLDLRSLALMRIAYGLLIVMDLAIRSLSFEQHYTETGAFPLEAAFRYGLRPDQFSFHVLSGLTEYQIFLFLFHAVAAVLLALGWRTRLMTVICFVMAVSLQNRNFLILNGGDNWMRLILFWAIFLPWGERFSLDAQKQVDTSPTNDIANVATVGMILQTMIVYFVSALYKTGEAWRSDGSAAQLALSQLEWNSDLGTYFLHFPKLLVLGTFFVLYLELIGPWLLISPVWSEQLRTITVLAFMSFHMSLEMTMELGVFPYVGIATLIGLLPALPWQTRPGKKLESRLSRLFLEARWNRRLIRHAGSSQPLTWRYTPLVLSTLIVFTLYLNAAGREGENLPLSRPLGSAARLLGFDQYWGLFAPEPGRIGGWFVFEGIFADGSRIELRTEQPLNWSEPNSSSIYPTQRIKRWMVGLGLENFKALRPYQARYLFNHWDRLHPGHKSQLVRVRGHYLSRPTLPNYEDPGFPTNYVFLDYTREQLREL